MNGEGSMYRKFVNRTLVIIISVLALPVLAVPMLIVAAVVKFSSKDPALFRQKRVGKGKKTFMMPKFRSMYIETPANIPTHPFKSSEKRITPVGRVLRKTSLDELPRLLSILCGDRGIFGTTKINIDFSSGVTA